VFGDDAERLPGLAANWSPTTIKGVTEAPQRRQAALTTVEQLGGRLIGTWLTQGQYDLVRIVDFPDESAAAAFALTMGRSGRLSTETLRGYSPEEADAIFAKLPS
jgi:uncharacterized protein with GYD domain